MMPRSKKAENITKLRLGKPEQLWQWMSAGSEAELLH